MKESCPGTHSVPGIWLPSTLHPRLGLLYPIDGLLDCLAAWGRGPPRGEHPQRAVARHGGPDHVEGGIIGSRVPLGGSALSTHSFHHWAGLGGSFDHEPHGTGGKHKWKLIMHASACMRPTIYTAMVVVLW